MIKQNINERFSALCREFLVKAEMVTNIEMASPRGGKWSLVFNGAVCEMGMQTARLFGNKGGEQSFQERLADKVAGFILSGHNAPHAHDILDNVDQDIIEHAKARGLHNLSICMQPN